MLTREKLDEIHRTLDAGSRAIGDARDAVAVGDLEAIKAALDQATTELGACKFALRGIRADE